MCIHVDIGIIVYELVDVHVGYLSVVEPLLPVSERAVLQAVAALPRGLVLEEVHVGILCLHTEHGSYRELLVYRVLDYRVYKVVITVEVEILIVSLAGYLALSPVDTGVLLYLTLAEINYPLLSCLVRRDSACRAHLLAYMACRIIAEPLSAHHRIRCQLGCGKNSAETVSGSELGCYDYAVPAELSEACGNGAVSHGEHSGAVRRTCGHRHAYLAGKLFNESCQLIVCPQQIVVRRPYVSEQRILPVNIEFSVLVSPQSRIDGSVRQTRAESDHRLTSRKEVRGMHALRSGIESFYACYSYLLLMAFGEDEVLYLFFQCRYAHDQITSFISSNYNFIH
ncbi:MAG: DUF452 family protein [Firmicutes bacterium]|nr:DUF452 family protein [Bacillota bacterium]